MVLLDLWRAALPEDAVDDRTFAAKVLADPNYEREGLLVARDGAERPAGFALCLIRRVPIGPGNGLDETTGWVTAFGVRPHARRCGVGTALLDAAEAFVRSRGRTRLEVSPYAPGYVWPGVDRRRFPGAAALLEGRGYLPVEEAAAMDRPLAGFVVPQEVRAHRRALEAEGYTFGPLSPATLRPLLAMTDSAFAPDWARSVREAVARRLPWDTTLVCTRNGAVLGFAQVGAYDHAPDRFGPFGVDPRTRGRGVGKVLLYMAMESLQAKGHHRAWFLWTDEHGPAGRLYKGAGFTVTRTFTVYGRDLAR